MPGSLTAGYKHAADAAATLFGRVHLTTFELLILGALLLAICAALLWRRRPRRVHRMNTAAMPPTWGSLYRETLAQAHERPGRLSRRSQGVDTFVAVQEQFMRVQNQIHEAVQQELASQDEAVHAR